MITPSDAIEVTGLVLEYGSGTRALDGLDMSVPTGTVLGLLGPNGAGKTTAVRIIATLLRPTAGTVRVAGIDALREPVSVRERIGLSGQYAAIDTNLTGLENLRLVAELYGIPRRQATNRAMELLGAFRLDDVAHRPAGTYSGGMCRRLDLAGALVARPPVVILDEPTTGLDPRTRSEMWQMIADLVADGTSVLLTTQYLEEAERLADSILIIDHGRIVATGSADELKASIGGERLLVTCMDFDDAHIAREVLGRIGKVISSRESEDCTVEVTVPDGSRTMVAALCALEQADIRVHDATLHRPTLDQVFLALTGRPPGNREQTSDGVDMPETS
ncbi:ATP-binding cassette domain-containing protein [Nocardia brasiliensis]